ncbi:MAG: universal stress protein [Rhodospirillales bacterium]|nr:universal stress protein [Rhodospirillales bacterium]MBO6785747.1 universal stress protein [Rhodospirillales bacterium]
MDIRSILAVVDGGDESRTVLTTALEMGRRLDAATALLHVTPQVTHEILPAADDMPTQAVSKLIDSMTRANEARHLAFESLIEETVSKAGIPVISPSEITKSHHFAVAKICITGHENREIAARGRLFDLVIIAIPGADSGGVESAVLEAALLDTARPVLIACPYPRPVIGGHVTVAWDGSREAAQSIRNALPLMRIASAIEIVHVADDPATQVNPEDICQYLSLHSLNAIPRTITAPKSEIAAALLDAARENGHALLVMGAYGAGAATEYMFGGVTRSVLSQADLPLLLSH